MSLDLSTVVSTALVGAMFVAVAETWQAIDTVRAANKTETRPWKAMTRENLVSLTRILLPAFGAVLLLVAAVGYWRLP